MKFSSQLYLSIHPSIHHFFLILYFLTHFYTYKKAVITLSVLWNPNSLFTCTLFVLDWFVPTVWTTVTLNNNSFSFVKLHDHLFQIYFHVRKQVQKAASHSFLKSTILIMSAWHCRDCREVRASAFFFRNVMTE